MPKRTREGFLEVVILQVEEVWRGPSRKGSGGGPPLR